MTKSIGGFNVLKPLRRMVEEKRRSLDIDDERYKIISGRRERHSRNKEYHQQGYRCKRDFFLGRKDGGAGGEFLSFLPGNYSGCPIEVKYGYYMDPMLASKIAGWVALVLNENEQSPEQRESFCHQALDAFRAVLRGEDFDIDLAIVGANMINQFCCAGGSDVPEELWHLAMGLSRAGDRIGVGTDFSYPNNSVLGQVNHSQRCETGDVLVDKSGMRGTKFLTKPININRTRFSFLKNKLRTRSSTRGKVSAAYQSLYHAVGKEKKRSNQTPYLLLVNPLYGATNDGSAASLEDDIYVALKEAVRFLALNPDVRIRFDGGTHTHAAFRDGLGKKLKEIFPDRDVTRPVEKVATVKLEESASDSAGDATRSVADKNANLTAESSSDKKTIVKPRKDASEENRSIGSRGSNSNADSSEDFRSEAGSEAESFDDRTEEARRTMESRGGFSQREKLEFDLKKPIEEGKRLVNAEPEAEGSGEQEPYKRKRMDGAKISRHPSWEGKYLPDLFSASVEGKNPAEKTKGLKSEGSKRGKISIFGRGVKLARNLINKKPVANEGGRKQPVSVGLPSVGSSSPDVGNIFVHGYQVSSVKGAGAKLEEYKEGLAALVGTLLKHWRDIEKPREIYVGKLSHDTEALSTAMKTFLLRINKLASDNCDLNVTAEIGEVKAWVEMWMESVEEVDRNVFGMHSSRDRYDENALTKHMNDFVRLLQDMEQSASAIKGDRIDVASSPKGVRKLVGEKSVEKEKGKKATSSRTPVVNVKEKGVTFPDNISRINEYGSNPSLLDERRPKVRRRSLDAESRISKSDRQVSPPKGPEYELARYKKHLALLAGPLLDHWTKVLESTEIDADRLLKDVESFSPSMEEFLSKVSHLESGSVSGKAGIKADKSWARDCRNEIGNIQIDLSIFYFEGDSGDKEELRTLLVRFVKLLKDVAE